MNIQKNAFFSFAPIYSLAITLSASFILAACGGASGTSSSEVVINSSRAVSSSSTTGVTSSVSSSIASSLSSSSSSSEVVGEDCLAPDGLSLTDIVSVVHWINAMPKPLSLPCFVKSIPRPMYYNATLSNFSAQPSIGRRSPRVFLQIGDLSLTVVPDERTESVKNPETGNYERVWDVDNIQLLEMGLQIPSESGFFTSIKGEIGFPVTETLPDNAAYAHVVFLESNSTCSGCHALEKEEGVLDGVPYYSSQMVRNDRGAEVMLAPMINEYLDCDPTVSKSEEYRCSMLEALYGQGILIWKSFPLDMRTL